MNKLGALSVMQVTILVVGIVAMSWAFGSALRGETLFFGKKEISFSPCTDACHEADYTCRSNCILARSPTDCECPTQLTTCLNECSSSSSSSSSSGTGATCPGSCNDVNKYTCDVGFVQGLCPGATNIQCCKGTATLKDSGQASSSSSSGSGGNAENGAAGEAISVCGDCSKICGDYGGDCNLVTKTCNCNSKPTEDKDADKNAAAINPTDVIQGFSGMKAFFDPLNLEGEGPQGEGIGAESALNMKIAFTTLASGITYAGIAYGLGRALFPLMGLQEGKADAASYSVASAVFVGVWMGGSMAQAIKTGNNLGFEGANAVGKAQGLAAGVTIVAAAAIATFMYFATWKEQQKITTTYTPRAWEAPFGGNYCELCNDADLGCSEYQCKSLGQACEIINAGTTDEKCYWPSRGDVDPPEIKAWEAALISDDYEYRDFTASSESKDKGEQIWFKDPENIIPSDHDGCIEAFTPLSFGVTMTEPAKCRIDVVRGDNYDDFAFDMGSPTYKYNHTITLSLPGPSTFEDENITLENGGEYEYYVKCVDPNGNENEGSFVFKFCVVDTEDTTPPRIVYTSPENNLPFGFNVTSIDVFLYIEDRQIDDCRWDRQDKEYDAMPEENTMTCGNRAEDMDAMMLWECNTELDGLNDDTDNKFYFRCKDKEGNVNKESFEYILKGSKPLAITDVGPTGTIKGSTNSVNVKITANTFAGYDKLGTSWCYFNTQNIETGWTLFDSDFATGNHIHSDEESLTEGTYTYYIKCLDLAGNEDRSSTTFSVDTDDSPPIVVRAYNDDPYLKIMTDEDANCVYDTVDCTYLFDDGIELQKYDATTHFTEWNPNVVYYIKCKDPYENEPAPNVCSIIVNPFQPAEFL